DRASNDLVAVAGVVVSEVQAPLADANLRASQRPTPFLVLRDASEVFAPLFNQWACLTVGAFDWQVTLVTEAEADAWFAAHPSPVVTVPALDLTVTGLVDVDDLGHGDVAFAGGTAANVGELRDLDETWMQRYFDFVTAGTTAEAATLRVRRSKALFLCRSCGETFSFDLRSGDGVACTACSSNEIELASGNELRIESIDVT
ncbi:MAG: hypothetical protein CVU63_22960, partial [Deltaproteobacteria bacterium HGW-Deltaproteobacteria-20]